MKEVHTGKTMGMPPRTGAEPSRAADSLSHNFSWPAASFQLRTLAPCSRTSTLSPVGSVAETREWSWVMSTVGCGGAAGVDARAEGLLGLSTMVAGVWRWLCG